MKIIVNDGMTPIPEGDCIIVAQNGFMLKRRNNWVDATVPIPSVGTLLPVETRARLLLPRIPSTVFAQAVLFFHAVYSEKKTEAAVLLHYRSSDKDWQITVPEQTATGGSVKYDPMERLPGYLCVGTMHSHCAMSAFHSGTDATDEMGHDGIHITIGKLDKFPEFEVDGEVVVSGARLTFPFTQVEGLTPQEAVEQNRWDKSHARMCTLSVPDTWSWTLPPEWVARVKEQKVFWKVWRPEGPDGKAPESKYGGFGFFDPGMFAWFGGGEDPRQPYYPEGKKRIPDDVQ